jgi:predicted nucleic acid-binding protein
MTTALYLDTSAVLRALLEGGTSPEVEKRIKQATLLVTSRLSLVEAARAVHRVRTQGLVSEQALADATRELEALWARCDVWGLTTQVCELAERVAPTRSLRTLDALHLSTYLLARRHIEGLELLTTDQRLAEAAGEP